MILWLDAQLSPKLADWISKQFDATAKPLKSLGLRDAADIKIFKAASKANAIVVTKDIDFVDLLNQHGPPPKIIWLRCGNISNRYIKELLVAVLPDTLQLLRDGQSLVEIKGTD